ncbi:MAG: penicillin-binding protein, partial [Pseudomonadota bacterium]
MIRSARKPVLFLAMAGSALAVTVLGLQALDAAFPPPLEQARVVSREVVDADGRLLRAFATPDGRWRLNVATKDVDPQFVAMLIAYEDQRFYQHHGVDPQAMLRAAWQMLTHGRIVSGGSTLTMQVARLLEPGQKRSLTTKITQIFRAFQLERRLSKDDILNLYLTHAPYGGNLEGVRSASLAYFGKDPRRLTVSEAALLVALPQLPEKRRPDRNPNLAEAARMRVLTRLAVRDVIGDGEAERAEHVAIPRQRMQLPALAAHLAEAALRKNPDAIRHPTTLRRDIQQQLETVARESGAKLGPKLSLAMVMADIRTGDIVAEVGSADYFDSSRSGWIDMTRIPRSPGSTLKPFIYGLAFEEGLVSQETIIEDRPADFYGYRPRNFDMTYQGDVSIREALQLSLNVPAIRLLNSVGPAQMMARFRRSDVRPVMPAHEAPGLAIGLGGLGITLKDLTQLYAALANRGKPVRLGNGVSEAPAVLQNQEIIEPVAAWNVTDILAGVQPPKGASR